MVCDWGAFRRIATAALVLVWVLTVAACGAKAPEGEEPTATTPEREDAMSPGGETLTPLDPPVVVKIAEDGSPSGAGFYIATERGYFEELGIKPEFVTFQSSAYMLPSVASGEVDVAGGIMTVSFLNAVERGLNIKIIADKGRNIPGKSYFDMVVAKRVADQIQTLEDMKGRRIAITSRGSIDEMFASLAVEQAGLTDEEVEYVVIEDFGQITPALANGSVDLAMHIEPLITQGETQGILDRWLDATLWAPDFQVAVVLSSPKFILERGDVAQRFMVAYLRGLRDYNDAFVHGEDLDAIIDIMAAYTPMKGRELWRQVNVVGLNPDGYVIDESIQFQIDWFRRKGYYEGGLKAEELIDHSLVDFALQHLGPYGN